MSTTTLTLIARLESTARHKRVEIKSSLQVKVEMECPTANLNCSRNFPMVNRLISKTLPISER